MFAEFGGVSVFNVAELCGVVSVSRFEVNLCDSDVCFGCVVVFTCDGGLVDYRTQQTYLDPQRQQHRTLYFLAHSRIALAVQQLKQKM